jgi:hypothetical protein
VPCLPGGSRRGLMQREGGEHMKAMKTAPVQVLHMIYKAA